MNPKIKTARKDLEQYFAAKKELDLRKKSGELDNLHHTLKMNDLQEKLQEKNYVAFTCLASAMSFKPRAFQPSDDSRYLEQLSRHEWTKARDWVDEWREANLYNITMGIVSVVENMVFPDLPTANPDVIRERMKAGGYPEETIQATIDSFLGRLKKD